MIGLLCFGQVVFAQDEGKTANNLKTEAKLIEAGSYQTSEVASLHIDMLRSAMQKSSNSKGLIIVYCGKTCRYGEVEAHLRGINLSLGFKGVKIEDFIILNGGFREKLTVEYWVIPENACVPIPNSTVKIGDVKFKGTFKEKFVPYECC